MEAISIVAATEDQLSWALSRILELEADLEEARDTVHRLIEGDLVGWEV